MTEHPVSWTALPHLFVLVTGAYLLSIAQVSGFTRNVVERMSSTLVCLGPNNPFSGYPQVKRGLCRLIREGYAVGAEGPGLAESRGWLPVRRNGRGNESEFLNIYCWLGILSHHHTSSSEIPSLPSAMARISA